jgi:hypothetical protein
MNSTFYLAPDLEFGNLSGISQIDVDQVSFDTEITFKDLGEVETTNKKRKLSESLSETLVENVWETFEEDETVIENNNNNNNIEESVHVTPPPTSPASPPESPAESTPSRTVSPSPSIETTPSRKKRRTSMSQSIESSPGSVSVSSSPGPSRRQSYTIYTKLQFLKKLDGNNGNMYKTCREEGVIRTTAIGWVKDRKKYEQCVEDKKTDTRKVRKAAGNIEERIQKAKFVDLEKELALWIDNDRKLGNSVSGDDIRNKALEIFNVKYKTGDVTFVASNGWVWRFMKRHGFTDRVATSVGQKIPANAKGISLFYFQNVFF